MKHSHPGTILYLLMTVVLCSPMGAPAMDFTDQANSVFRFQQKLADSGNSQAQYKLAMMYEAGVGVDKDIEQARQWYSRSSKAGNKAASDRITFLAVKQDGYQKDKHSTWLEGVKKDAREGKSEAMIMLGQMYRNGIGVKKDLNKSLELLSRVNSSGEENVDKEILAVRGEIAAARRAEAEAKQQKELEMAAIHQPTAEPARVGAEEMQAQSAEQAAELAARKAAEKEKLQAEKRRRYEQVMEQIRLEEKMIREQQTRVSGGVAVAVDEEF